MLKKRFRLAYFGSLLLIALSACNNSSPAPLKSTIADSISSKNVLLDSFSKEINLATSKQVPTADTFYKLLKTADTTATNFLSETLPILFFRSGSVFSKEQTNAVLLSSPTDSTYKLEVFTLIKDSWEKNDSIILKSQTLYFDISFIDYNFDGFNDIFIQCSNSNGFAISRGYLLTVDKKSKQITPHPEARKLGNMQPDSKTRSVNSEEFYYCKDLNLKGVCELQHNWTKNKLIEVKKNCGCN